MKIKDSNKLMAKEIINQEENVKYCEDTIKLFTQTQFAFISLAKRLQDIRDNHRYAPQWGSFREFCLEMNELSISQVSRLIGIHEKFVLNAGIDEEELGKAGWTKLAMTLPLVRTKDEAEYWADQAKTLTKTDLSRAIKEQQTGVDMAKCIHEDTYLLRICKDCHVKFEEHDVSLINADDIQTVLVRKGIDCSDEEAKEILEALVKASHEA